MPAAPPPATAPPPPASPPGAGGGGGGAPVPDAPPTDSAPAADSSPAWAGDLEALDREPWYTALSEDVRTPLRSGYEARLRTYERGVQEKFRVHADERRAHQEAVRAWEAEKATHATEREAEKQRLTEAERRANLYDKIFAGEEDPRIAESAKAAEEWEAEKAAWAAERATHEGAIAAKEAEYRAELDRLRGDLSVYEQQAIAEEQARLVEAYSDILDHPEAIKAFAAFTSETVTTDGKERPRYTEEQAAAMTRALHQLQPAVRAAPPAAEPPPPAARQPAAPPAPAARDLPEAPALVPDSVSLASPGDRGPAKLEVDDFEKEDMYTAIRRAAEKTMKRVSP